MNLSNELYQWSETGFRKILYQEKAGYTLTIWNIGEISLPTDCQLLVPLREVNSPNGIQWKSINEMKKNEYVGLNWNKSIHIVTKLVLQDALKWIHQDNLDELLGLHLYDWDIESLLILFQNIQLAQLGPKSSHHLYLCFQSAGLVLFGSDRLRLQPENIQENTKSVRDQMFLKVLDIKPSSSCVVFFGSENEYNVNGLLVRQS